jgi:hypothetical protein
VARRVIAVTRHRWAAAVLVACLAAATAQAAGPEPRSGSLTKELTTLMTGRQMDAIAAHDPQSPGRFVAAMLFPGVQLLVVEARHPSPDTMQARLFYKQYRDLYFDLQQPSITEGKVFIQDLGCDGLQADGEANIDIMYEGGKTQTLFDGEWKKKGQSEQEYKTKFQQAEEQYSRMLGLLIAELKR